MTYDASHTPGRWSFDWHFIVAPDPKGVHPDIYIAEIAEEDEDGRVAPPEQQEANKRLIAAAPDLLKALDGLLEIFDAEIAQGILWNDPRLDYARLAFELAVAA